MEKKNYNIKIDQPQPSASDIQKHMDFDGLLGKMGAVPDPTPTGKIVSGNFWQYSIGALLVGAAAVALLFFNPHWLENQQADPMTVHNYVNPPIKDIQAQFASFKVDANKGGTFEYGNGSKVIVPPAVFVDKDGKEITGEVELNYREFHDFVDFFLSGIPMHYDSAGTRYQLESSGMMEIQANQNGTPLNIKPQSTIDIELMSNVAAGKELDYNIYFLDEKQENWSYVCKDKIEKQPTVSPLEKTKTEIKQINIAINKLEARETAIVNQLEAEIPAPPKPRRPEEAKESDYIFNFEVDKSEFPEIAAYDKVLWKVGTNNPTFQKRWYKVDWDDVELKKISKLDYQMTLLSENEVVELSVSPVLKGEDLRKAQAEFAEKDKVYQAEFLARQQAIAKKKQERTRAIAERKKELKAKKQQVQAKIKDLQAKGNDREAVEVMMQQNIKNQFAVSRFGTWNCDIPLPSYEHILVSNFVDENQQSYKGNAVFHVDKNTNTIMTFYISGKDKLWYDIRSENLLWLVTKEGKLAVFDPKGFKGLEDKKEHTFVMKTMDQVVKSEADIRRILKFN